MVLLQTYKMTINDKSKKKNKSKTFASNPEENHLTEKKVYHKLWHLLVESLTNPWMIFPENGGHMSQTSCPTPVPKTKTRMKTEPTKANEQGVLSV
jgi:hypothetical protein